MKLFKYEGYKIVISEEALAIKAFRDIWNRDRSVSKDKAILELGFLYFFLDPRSDYAYIINEEDRLNIIKEQQGFGENWKPDAKLKIAMNVYKTLTTTTGSLLLDSARVVAERLRDAMTQFDIQAALTEEGSQVFSRVAKATTEIPKIVQSIAEAEKIVNAEIIEGNKLRADKQKTIAEDGFDRFFNDSEDDTD